MSDGEIIEITKNERVFSTLAHFLSEFLQSRTHFPFSAGMCPAPGLYSLFMRRNSCAPPLSDPACHCSSNRAEHLLIHRIQSHTNPKRRKGFLKQAGQKSSQEELPKQRKGPKRAVEYQLKVQTHIWEQDAGSSSLPTRTKREGEKDIEGNLLVFSSLPRLVDWKSASLFFRNLSARPSLR